LKLGIENVHRETYLTSLEVAKEVLMEKGYARSDINGKLAEFRNRDEAILRQQMNFVDNQEEFIHFTSQANRELEQILKLEKEEVEAHTETNPETLQPEA
jgi:glutathione-regulated potassium-efflux system protein KefB